MTNFESLLYLLAALFTVGMLSVVFIWVKLIYLLHKKFPLPPLPFPPFELWEKSNISSCNDETEHLRKIVQKLRSELAAQLISHKITFCAYSPYAQFEGPDKILFDDLPGVIKARNLLKETE